MRLLNTAGRRDYNMMIFIEDLYRFILDTEESYRGARVNNFRAYGIFKYVPSFLRS